MVEGEPSIPLDGTIAIARAALKHWPIIAQSRTASGIGFPTMSAASRLAAVAVDGAELDAYVGDARVLTDDHAPVDQLLLR